MINSVNQRLKQVVEHEKFSAPDFYKKIGVARNVYSDWINNVKPIPLNKVQKILELLPNLDARWFLTGEGTMYANFIPAVNNTAANSSEPHQPYCQGCSNKLEKIHLLHNNIKSLEHTIGTLKDLVSEKQKVITLLEGQTGKANCG
jgi:hypothetical protein